MVVVTTTTTLKMAQMFFAVSSCLLLDGGMMPAPVASFNMVVPFHHQRTRQQQLQLQQLRTTTTTDPAAGIVATTALHERVPKTTTVASQSAKATRTAPTATTTTASSNNNNKANNNDNNNKANNNNNNGVVVKVVYQKVVRPPPGTPSVVFLGHLVEYLQDRLELPERLPMVYEKVQVLCDDDDNDDEYAEYAEAATTSSRNNNNGNSAIVQWNSPLSPNAAATALHVQVVGIYTEQDPHVPSMAMVVVEKLSSSSSSLSSLSSNAKANNNGGRSSSSSSNNSLPPMLANLFADSEKKILKALDRGLEDFMAGEIANLGGGDGGGDYSDRSNNNNRMGRDAILAELLEDEKEMRLSRYSSSSSSEPLPGAAPAMVVDADVVQKNGVNVSSSSSNDPKADAKQQQAQQQLQQQQQQQQQRREAVLKTMRNNDAAPPLLATTTTIKADSNGLEFAVQAAKLAQAKRKQRQKEQGGIAQPDFAVQDATEAATAKQRSSKTPVASNKEPVVPLNEEEDEAKDNDGGDPMMSIDLSTLRPPSLDPQASSGVRRRAFMTTISKPSDYIASAAAAAKQETAAAAAKQKTAATPKQTKSPAAAVDSPVVSSSAKVPKVEQDGRKTTNKTINISVRENEREPVIGLEDRIGESNEIIQATQDALNEMAEKGADLTPEELLAEVMKFGDQQERKEAVGGDGFVSGAFEKAKDILREQKEQRDERIRRGAIDQATATVQRLAAPGTVETREAGFKELTAEEELRRMFEAGARIADGRITTTTTSSNASILSAASKTTEKEIDDLIDSDKTVSRYARILDDELAELEVRINKSPGEQFDSPDRNPLFDIFSGPEVYDLNVDPLKAVNWPGALPGTKNVRLPKELAEAVKQAKFAVEVLTNMREIQSSDGSKTFMVGERELTAQQIANLRAVVEEAVEIGLIDDPIEIQAEASRLLMLLDELTWQPEERMREIASNYKDLLLSDNFVGLVKQRLNEMADRDVDALRRDDDSLEGIHARERELLGQLVVYAQLLLKEVRALGAELESQQLEVIRSICKVAMDPSHQTEEETAMALTDAVRDMRPLFDDAFIAYLKYAVAEEEGRLARAGLLDDPEHNQWLFVLKIVQQGVYAEIAKGINRYVDHIGYILRMETPIERSMLLEKLVDVMPTLDVRPFVQVVENIVGALGDSVRGEFDGVTPLGEMSNKLLQLHRDLKRVLPPERIAEKSRDADEWAAKQKQRLMEQRNLTKQRLKGAQATEHLDGEVEAFGRRGDVERFD